MHNLDLKINGSKVTKTWGKQACNSNMLPDPELRKCSFINFGAMKGFNFSRFGKVQRQQHQEELAAQQVKYMHQHLGSSQIWQFLLSHTKSSKTSSEPFGVVQVFACFCLKMFIYIPSILHMCYDSYHPSKTRTCFFTFCLGGGLFEVKPWTCRGAQITLEELEFWIAETVSPYQQEEPLCEEQDWFFNHNLCDYTFFCTMHFGQDPSASLNFLKHSTCICKVWAAPLHSSFTVTQPVPPVNQVVYQRGFGEQSFPRS